MTDIVFISGMTSTLTQLKYDPQTAEKWLRETLPRPGLGVPLNSFKKDY